MRNYSIIASPLTSLLKGRPSNLKWTGEARQAYNTLKERFTTATILKHPDSDLPFVVEVDASDCGIEAVLSQLSLTISMRILLKKLTTAENN